MSRLPRRDLAQLVELLHDTLPAAQRSRLEARLEREPALALAYERMQAARHACGDIAQQAPPTPSWREMDARLHWRLARQTEQAAKGAGKSRVWAWRWALGLGVAAALGLALGILISSRDKPPGAGDVTPIVATPAPATATQKSAAQELAALAVSLSGDVRVLPAAGSGIVPLSLQRPLVLGDRVLTGKDGIATLQWQERTGAQLRPGGELALSRLTSSEQRLRLFSGEAFFEVQRRRAEERLEVIAGSLRIEVVGTRFSLRLTRSYAELVVDEGAVRATPIDEQSLATKGPSVKVETGYRLRVDRSTGKQIHLQRLDLASRPAALYLTRWKGLHRVLASTGVLHVKSRPAAAQLHLDGQSLGPTDMRLRAAEGRHLVELRRHGRLIERRWVEVDMGKEAELAIHIKVKDPAPKLVGRRPTPDPSATSIHELFRRRAPLIRSCYQRRLKREPGLSGKVVLRIRVDAAGKALRVDISKNTMGDSGVAQCVQGMIRTWAFPRGQAATVTYPFVFRPR